MERRRRVDAGADPRADIPAAVALAAGAIAALALMPRHPSVSASGLQAAVAEIAREGPTSRAVHGALLAALALLLFGFTGLAARLGWTSASARAGAVAYGLGTVCMLGAALVSGFVVPDLAERHAGAAAGELEALRPLLRFGHASNQALAQVGTVGWSLAIAAWSLPLLKGGTALRALALLGLAVGAAPTVGLLSGRLRLDVHGMALVVLAQALWALGVALWLARPALSPCPRRAPSSPGNPR